MRLYSKLGQSTLSSEEFGEFTADENGAVEIPDDFGRFLHNQHINGELAWEDDAERAARLVAEEHARRSDPAYLAGLVEELSAKVNAPKPTRAKSSATN